MKHMKKIVVASDSFKGSLSSGEVATCCERAIRRVFPGCEVEKIPVGDGGEGTADALVEASQGRRVECMARDPLTRPVRASYGISGDGRTAVIEMAAASGLTLLSPGERNPLLTTTLGTGDLIRDALDRGCREFLVCIGGSATNDAGMGMLQALGFRFLGSDGEELGQGGMQLEKVRAIDDTGRLPQLAETRFTVACDVDNPFCGEQGAAYVFGRQKGADDAMIRRLDNGLRHFADLIASTRHIDLNAIPGSGAAGGLGGGFVALLGARLKPGIDMVLDTLRFDERIKGADLIITGEGRLDSQTLMGKTPFGVLHAGTRQGIPVIAIGGSVESEERLIEAGFTALFPIQPAPLSLEEALRPAVARHNIERTVEMIMRTLKI